MIFIVIFLHADDWQAMNALKYSRLPTSDPGPEFSALDGPSYFSYEIERKKYGSAFSYTGTAVDTETIHPVGKVLEVSTTEVITVDYIYVFAHCVSTKSGSTVLELTRRGRG